MDNNANYDINGNLNVDLPSGSNGYDLAITITKYLFISGLAAYVANKIISSDKEIHYKNDANSTEFDISFKKSEQQEYESNNDPKMDIPKYDDGNKIEIAQCQNTCSDSQ